MSFSGLQPVALPLLQKYNAYYSATVCGCQSMLGVKVLQCHNMLGAVVLKHLESHSLETCALMNNLLVVLFK